MKRLTRLLAPLGLATIWLALILGAMWLFTHANDAFAAPHTVALSMPQEAPATDLTPAQGPTRGAAVSLQADDAPDISNIAGATYDEARGEIIVFGIADPDLPPLDLPYLRENLVVALRAFYDSGGPELPGVSIEGTLDPLDVIYFGGITNTHFGQVSFESDRLLKIYTLGVDNLTGITVTSNVTGYMSFPDRMQRLTETVEDPIVIRYFFTPTLLVEPITSPHSIVFSQTQKIIEWAYMSVATSTATAEAAQGFVDNFNQYYFDYAAERRANYGDTTLYEMVQLSKLAAIAQWAHDEELELKLPGLNDPWLDHYPVPYATTVTQTTGITVTWVQTISGTPYEVGLRGGVYAPGYVKNLPPTPESRELVEDVKRKAEKPTPPPIIHLIRPSERRCILSNECCQTEGPLMSYNFHLADNAVRNGDFEDGPGSGPWVQQSLYEIISDQPPHNGIYGAWFGDYDNAQEALYQILHIPADATLARVTYWRAALTGETTHPHDFFTSLLTEADGTPLTALETLDDGDADGFWREASFDVSAYADRTARLGFAVTTNESNPTSFFLDDVSLDYLDYTPPTVTSVNHLTDTVSLSSRSATQASSGILLSDTAEFIVTFHEPMKVTVAPTVTIRPQGSAISYTLVPSTGSSYTNGYLDSDPTQWHGLYTFTLQMPEGTYTLDVAAAQDLADNVMHTAENAYTFSFNAFPPQVDDTFPAAGASGVPLNADIIIAFSEAISTSTFAYTVSPNPGGWAESWDSGGKVVTLSHNDFAANTTYTVTVIQAKDLAGNSLSGAPLSWWFTTSAAPDLTPPQVQSTFPADGASGVPVDASIVITFSEEINTSTFDYTASPDPGGWVESWDGKNEVVTLAHDAFEPGTTFTITVIQARDLAGNALSGAPYAWSFKTAYAVYLPAIFK